MQIQIQIQNSETHKAEYDIDNGCLETQACLLLAAMSKSTDVPICSGPYLQEGAYFFFA